MSNGDDQSQPGPTEEQLADMPSAQLPPPAPSGYHGPVDARLVDLRAPYGQQFQDNPDLARKFLASMHAEVGDLSPEFQQGYVEAVLNRSANRHETLDYTLSNDHDQWYGTGKNRHRGYYAHSTIAQLGKQFSPEELSNFQELLHNAMQGSNVANYGTGNESGELHNGPTALAAGDTDNNRLIIESLEQPWWKTMTSSPPKAPLVSAPLGAGPLGSPDIVRPPASENPPVTPVRRALPVQTFQNPASGNIEPVQSFAKGGMVLPIPEEPDEDSYTPVGKHLGGPFGAINA